MAGNALKAVPKASSLAMQEEDFTAEGAPAPPVPAATTPEDCMVALDQLDTKLDIEIERRHVLEQEVRTARNALDTARRELVGTQAGERYARHLALHDELTSLPNRSGFLQRLTYQLKHLDAQRPAAALLFLDLDAFKPINDEHGHAVGDEVLRVVGARLYRAVRADDMMSRLGGDEFACLPAAYLNWTGVSRPTSLSAPQRALARR
jgi:GGDEF domain-containing protein